MQPPDTSIIIVFLFGFALAASYILTKRLGDYFRQRNVVDEEGTRTLHVGTIPRAGGLAIVVSVCLSQVILVGTGVEIPLIAVGWWILAVVIAALGFSEDTCGVNILVRLLVQVFIAFGLLSLASLGNEKTIWVFIISTMLTVWVINAANFMDGADGLLASQAIIVSAIVGVYALLSGNNAMAFYLFAFVGAIAGFLIWNWQPASIFLGDVGSYFIGFNLAALLWVVPNSNSFRIAIFILLIPLLTDASITLVRRLLAGEKIWYPHRSHAYQLVILSGQSHSRTVMMLAAITFFLFGPLSVIAFSFKDISIECFLIGCASGLAIWVWTYRRSRR